MSGELTRDEIISAAKMANKIYYEDSTKGREAAQKLKGRMVLCGNTDSDSKYYFNQYSPYSWEYLD